MPSPERWKMEMLDERPDAVEDAPRRIAAQEGPIPSPREAQLLLREQAVIQAAQIQQRTGIYIQTLLGVLGLRCLLLLGLAGSTALTWLILTNPAATPEKMILVAAADALLVLPLIWLIAKKA